jgi:hypothetical protein
VQVIAAPDGWPLWVSPVRPGREHDTTCARAHGLVDALNRLTATLGIPTLTDLGYRNVGPGFRYPVKKPRGSEPFPTSVWAGQVQGEDSLDEAGDAGGGAAQLVQ